MDIIKSLYSLYEDFPLEKGVLGFTGLGYPIPYFCLKFTPFPVVFAQGGIHAREFITTRILIDTLSYLPSVLDKGCIYIAPAINLDGIRIVKEIPDYKANANGVDLNTNFPARWGTGAFNKQKRGKSDYIGKSPASESEVKALTSFTGFIKPDITLSYHSKGEEIYYDFFDEDLKRKHFRFANAVAMVTGYKIKENLPSAGGYKDWCVQDVKIPALTIEVGSDALIHPIGEEFSKLIFNQTKDIIPAVVKEFFNA